MRHLDLFLDSCNDCPYRNYDPDYCPRDSGHDCWHPLLPEGEYKRRIIDDNDLKKLKKFPDIPKWCPLPVKTTKRKVRKT